MTDTRDFVGSDLYDPAIQTQLNLNPSLTVTLSDGQRHGYHDGRGNSEANHSHDYVVDSIGVLHVIHTRSWTQGAPKATTARSYAAGAWVSVEGSPLGARQFVGSESINARTHPGARPYPAVTVALTGGSSHEYFDVSPSGTAVRGSTHTQIVDGGVLHVIETNPATLGRGTIEMQTARTYAPGAWVSVSGPEWSRPAGLPPLDDELIRRSGSLN